MKVIDNHFGEHLTIDGYGAVYDYEGVKVGQVVGGAHKVGRSSSLAVSQVVLTE